MPQTVRLIPLLLALSLAPAQAASPTTGLNLGLTCPSGTPIWMPEQNHAPFTVVVLQFLSHTASVTRLMDTEHRTGGTIDPAYVNNQRVLVRISPSKGVVAVVPAGMQVQLGEVVTFIPGHAEPDNPCVYIPNLLAPSALSVPQ
jgi:hypothetical protein